MKKTQFQKYQEEQERKQAWWSFIQAALMTVILIGFTAMVIDLFR